MKKISSLIERKKDRWMGYSMPVTIKGTVTDHDNNKVKNMTIDFIECNN